MRTTAVLVAGIIEVDASIDLIPFITAANALVTEVCTTLDETRLELVERWLSAHFYTNRDPRITAERAGPVSANYQSAVALNLATSHYGQTAMLLDTSGALALLNKATATRKASVVWLGTPLGT